MGSTGKSKQQLFSLSKGTREYSEGGMYEDAKKGRMMRLRAKLCA